MVKLVIAGNIWNITSAYAPQSGLDQAQKDSFYASLEDLMKSISSNEYRFIGADFNGHVGALGVMNNEGEALLNFSTQHELAITNTYFLKPERHLATYKSGNATTQIDYLVCDKSMRNMIKDCKVILGESLTSQHRLLLAEIQMIHHKKKKDTAVIVEKIKWHRLKES